ncbi:hydrogenase nickel incorporation protein HypA [Pelotomaculum terephthalicicum JT]|uniref:hydrogenase nickel incorporation protein HypA n=1 Tax=Pelotomaculum terephthalicicum TaxID=206393 RepID=UPI0009CC5ACA|nr:hydrogenase nickel incorporation protein HypA [Pelotomaculum terephthalicicum]MCG9969497.1 hydrogenase nickel incorporation protein HypA [Pelotomaculum terephthalicicum JT]OPY61863.1 MAG: hydrogenase nickel incorporation protein [Pelotomaculum sp. PtaU1.Bin065]
MHEWALAESIVFTVNEEAVKEKLKDITMVKVKVGELQQIELDIFKFALENVLPLSSIPLNMARIDIEIDESTLKCNVCRNEWNFRDAAGKLPEEESEAIHFIPEVAHIYMRCPRCGSPDFEIAKGRGVWIDYIEGER